MHNHGPSDKRQRGRILHASCKFQALRVRVYGLGLIDVKSCHFGDSEVGVTWVTHTGVGGRGRGKDSPSEEEAAV